MLARLSQMLKKPWVKKIMGYWNKIRTIYGKIVPIFNMLKPLMSMGRQQPRFIDRVPQGTFFVFSSTMDLSEMPNSFAMD